MTGHVDYRAVDGVATVVLNRPERRNAFTFDMLRECVQLFGRAAGDDAVRVIVITGAGDAFCAGGDVTTMGKAASAVDVKANLWECMQAVPRTLARIDKPVIAMINGDAIGGGMDMALMCDIRLASDTARMSEGYVRLGLVPGDGGAYFLPRLAPFGRALELLLTGDFISASEAERFGIVNRVVPRDQLEPETYALARRIASLPPLGVRMTKRLTYQSAKADLETALDLASSHVAIVQATEDHREAVAAFREKRQGQYIGR